MRKILALLSHGDPDFGGTQLGFSSTDNSLGGEDGGNSSGPVLGKQVSIGNHHYSIDAVIAEGGFGVVYRVHSPDGKQYALKRTLVNNDVDLASMKREITIVSSLMHKNIISYVASKVTKKEPEIHEILLLTAYYPGSVSQVLAERQQKGLRFLEVEILQILADVCEAVSRLHHCETPIIHRDLKIENLLIDERKNVVLCDFGSATSRILHPVKHGTLRCQEEIEKYTTLAYRAPEMVDLYSGIALGPPVDIWALGCILYGLCFFALPFGSGSALAIQTGRYTVPTTALSSYSLQLLKLLHYMLTVSARERPDIFQVSALVFSLLGQSNPVLNVNSSNVPDWQSLSVPPTVLTDISTKTSSTILNAESRNDMAASKMRLNLSTSNSKHTSISPSIARRRPRASGVTSPSSVEGSLPILAKPPNPPRQLNPQHNAQMEALVKVPQTVEPAAASPEPSFFNRRVSGHRRGLSEASALILKAKNVRQTNSLGDLQPSTNPFESKSPEAKRDIDVDLFGAAFDAIRNQNILNNKFKTNNSYRSSTDSGQFKDDTQGTR